MNPTIAVRLSTTAILSAWLAATAAGQASADNALVPAAGAEAQGFPGVDAALEQDANLRSPTSIVPFPPGVDLPVDWADNSGGPGIIGEAGAPFMFLLNLLLPPSVAAEQPIVQGSQYFSAKFCRDPNTGPAANPATGIGTDRTQFTGGGATNNDLIGAGQLPWTWGDNGGLAARLDITNGYLAAASDECGHTWLLFAVESRAGGGDVHIDLEVNRAGIQVTETGGPGSATGQLVGNGPLGGRTVGDLILSLDSAGGGQPVLTVRRATEPVPGTLVWQPIALAQSFDCLLDGTPDDVDGDGDLVDHTAFVRTNNGGVPGGGWGHFANNGADTLGPAAFQFIEGALDLTPYGAAGLLAPGPGTVLFKSRTGGSFGSELRDFNIVSAPEVAVVAGPLECAISGPTTVCPGATATYTVEAVSGGPLVDVFWAFSGAGTVTLITDTTLEVLADSTCPSDFTVTAVVTNAVGDSSTCSLVVPVELDEPPDIECPADVTVEFGGSIDPAETGQPVVTDSCGGVPLINYFDNAVPGCGSTSTIARTWEVHVCNFAFVCTQTIQVVDTTPPVIDCPPDQTLQCGDTLDVDLTAFDNNGVASYDAQVLSGPANVAKSPPSHFMLSFFGAGTVVVRWTVEDLCGNVATCETTYTVQSTMVVSGLVDQVVPEGAASVSFGPVQVSGGTPGYGFLWYKDGVLLAPAGNTLVVPGPITAADAGTYCVSVGDSSGCSAELVCADLIVGSPESLTGQRHPGSVGIFPVHRSGLGGGHVTGGSGVVFFTIVSVTNTDTQPQTPQSLGGSTNVHYEYVNVTPNTTNPFLPLACTIFDRVEFLTPADTLSVLTSCHNAVAPSGQQGYLVVSAQDPTQFDVDWSHNDLIGSEIVINGSGGMYQVAMVGVRSPLADGEPTELLDQGGRGNGQLDFDGNEYFALPEQVHVDTFVALAGSRLALANLTGGLSARNTLKISAWNDNEFPLSATRAFACWFDEPLQVVSPLFNQTFLAQNTPDDPEEVDLNCDHVGDIETAWARIDSIDVSFPFGGQIAADGVVLGAVTAGPGSMIDGGTLLWESRETQDNGSFGP